MGLNRRKMDDERRDAAEKEAAARRATDKQILEDAERLVAAWNERQAARLPMLFSSTIGAAVTAKQWFLHVRCPACRTTRSVDLRQLDWHQEATVCADPEAVMSRVSAQRAIRGTREAFTEQRG
jgi:hypothetical protein